MGPGYSECPELDIFLYQISAGVGRGVRAIKGALHLGASIFRGQKVHTKENRNQKQEV